MNGPRPLPALSLPAALLAWTALALPAPAETATPGAAPHPAVSCQPQTDAPRLGKDDDKPLSDKLAQSHGVICPPSGLDPKMAVPPPGGGKLKVIPPPTTPEQQPK